MVGTAGRHREGRGPVTTDLGEPRTRLTAWLDIAGWGGKSRVHGLYWRSLRGSDVRSCRFRNALRGSDVRSCRLRNALRGSDVRSCRLRNALGLMHSG